MIINELIMNQDSHFTDVQCSMLTKQRIVTKIGRVEMIGNDKFRFITKDNVINFCIVDKAELKLIIELFNKHYYCLANVTSYSINSEEGKIFFLHLAFFYNLQRWGKIPVIISDEIRDSIEKKYIKGRKKLEEVLKENFKISDGVNSYFSYTSGKYYFEPGSIDEDDDSAIFPLEELEESIEIDKIENNDENILKKEKKETLVIYGKDFCIYTSIKGEKINAKLYVEKIGKKKQNVPMMRLAEGSLEFFEHNFVLSEKVKETLENTKGYLDLWNQYAEQEGRLLLEEVRKIGIISVNRSAATFDSEGIHLPYSGLSKEAKELIGSDKYLFFSDEIPIYLANDEMTWSDYRSLSRAANKNKYSINKGVHIRIKKIKNNGFIIETKDGNLPKQKYVSLSILGDEEQISRREEARNRIAEGKAANPALGLILEGQLTEEIGAYSTRKKIMPLSSFVKEKIFKYDPTETQKKAIDIALNTPDIAIIQGPPGTGKTTVITAMIERLNELCNKNEKVNGQVLITSFQHDAVRNVIERLKINSLPTIKFGKQERAGEEDLTREKVIEEWCEEYIQKLNEKNPELIETEKRNSLSKLHNIYLIYPSDKNALEFLYCAKEINTDVEIDKQITKLIEGRNILVDNKISELLILVRRLRTTKEGFIDDGADNADDLLEKLENMELDKKIQENKKILDILYEAAMYYEKEPTEELLNRISEVKKYLLDKCIPKPSYKKEIPDEEISKIYRIINQSVKKYKNEKEAILADLLKELRMNRSEVEKSLEHYLFVYSATTQQSEGKEIKEAKGIMNKYSDKHPEYETVIVDEAARVSPADLMIPLAQAKKRIILVGDHRQLPHIYDEEVFESMKENGETVEMNNIKKSMFEYLLEKARELEKIDHVSRTIVLDAQYRMHPILGEFINEVFYRPNEEQFASPLPAINYQQYISKKNFPLEWYNFPDEYGKEHKIGTSRVRDCEIDFIVEKLEYYMNLEEGKNLSYGVITFYSEQVKAIKQRLENKLGDVAKQVRVGSVDAFQGMEFDVIFLSVVRSNDRNPIVRINRELKSESIDFEYLEKYKKLDNKKIDKNSEEYRKWELYREKVGMQNYGFLISENRLCVSLSRQKKLLIVVGNAEIFYKGDWGRIAEICVPGMKKLYELCKGEEVIYDGQSESI